jgi:hypothetical protein
MEIQTFVFCSAVRELREGKGFNGELLGVHSFFSKDGTFPLAVGVPYFMLLRRETRGPDEVVTLRFSLVDMDGKQVGEPKDFEAEEVFTGGHMFMTRYGHVRLVLPGVGDYRLDITADEGKLPFVYHYNLEVTEPPGPELGGLAGNEDEWGMTSGEDKNGE